eukprot:3925238-Pyramimonas_sp.AAC.1
MPLVFFTRVPRLRVRSFGMGSAVRDGHNEEARLPDVLFLMLGGTSASPSAYTELLSTINNQTNIAVLGLSYVSAPFTVEELNNACGDPTRKGCYLVGMSLFKPRRHWNIQFDQLPMIRGVVSPLRRSNTSRSGSVSAG